MIWLLTGVSFLGLPPLPSVPLPYKDNSAPAPVSLVAAAPAPEQATGESTLKSFLSSFVDVSLFLIDKRMSSKGHCLCEFRS